MKIHVTEEVAKWYKNELSIQQSTYLRYYVRYGGIGGHIPGFSLGINFDTPENVRTSTKVDNITFYIEEADEWYFDGKDLKITLNDKKMEPEFTYD